MNYRYAVLIEYDGTNFCGWQIQNQQGIKPSVCAILEKAIAIMAQHPIKLVASGRTDAGVHALGQVAHFETKQKRTYRQWLMGINNYLPQTIRVLAISPVKDNFHARFSAVNREYCYQIYNAPHSSCFNIHTQAWYGYALDEQKMHQAAQLLVGEKDFAAFRASSCSAQTSTRRVLKISVKRQGRQLDIIISANAFLHHMVRNIAGSLLLVGSGLRDKAWFEAVLLSKDRNLAAKTAAPQGLYLQKITYPKGDLQWCFYHSEMRSR